MPAHWRYKHGVDIRAGPAIAEPGAEEETSKQRSEGLPARRPAIPGFPKRVGWPVFRSFSPLPPGRSDRAGMGGWVDSEGANDRAGRFSSGLETGRPEALLTDQRIEPTVQAIDVPGVSKVPILIAFFKKTVFKLKRVL